MDKRHGLRLLSLDGGNAQCLSQLLLLREALTRHEHDIEKEVRPCDYFDAITGAGAAGVISIFLGVLGLTVDKAMEAFVQICKEVFADGYNEATRSAKLVDVVKTIFKELQIPESTRLRSSTSTRCHVSICYSAVPNVSCRLFRSYPTRHASYNPTIVEAIRATWARPGLFSSIRVGAGPLQEELVSSMSGFDNPTLEAIKEAKDVFGGDTKISSILSLGCGKKRVANGTDTSETAENAQEAERVTGVLQRHLDTSGVYYRLSVEEGIEDSFTDIETHLQSVVAHTQGYLTDDTVSCSIDSYLKLSQHPSPFGLGEVYINSQRPHNIHRHDLMRSDFCDAEIGAFDPGFLPTILVQAPPVNEAYTLSNILQKDVSYPGTNAFNHPDAYSWPNDLSSLSTLLSETHSDSHFLFSPASLSDASIDSGIQLPTPRYLTPPTDYLPAAKNWRRNKFHCSECGKSYDRAGRARDCRNKDLGLVPYICRGECGSRTCDRKYSSEALLRQHLSSPERRSRTCSRCGRSILKQNMARHRTSACPNSIVPEAPQVQV